MILKETKSGTCLTSSHLKWDKMLDDHSWFLPHNTCQELVLIEACKRGDPLAQLRVYKSYRKQMFEISYSLVCNSHTANEIVRESFMVAFEKTVAIKRQVDFISFLSSLVEEKSVESRNRSNTRVPGLATDRMLQKK